MSPLASHHPIATWLTATNHSPSTVRNRKSALARLARWSLGAGVCSLDALTLDVLEMYRLTLLQARSPGGGPLCWGTQAEYLGSVKAFLGWCFLRGLVVRNAASALQLPRRPFQLPMSVLSPGQVEVVLGQPETMTPLGLRDRALLEVLYSTGIRRAEVAQLTVADVDAGRGVLLIRAGKGQRDRVVPIGSRALRWIARYLRYARPTLLQGGNCPTLFLTSRGGCIRLNRLSELVARYVAAGADGKRGSCHLFRHTMATLVLDGGADIRDVQAMLGHANLSTTARYTHVSIARLQAVHARTHPAERRDLRKSR